MQDDVGDIAALYDSDPEKEQRRLAEHQLEYDLTWRYLERYLPAEGAVLEIGAAAGRYTLQLARRGYRVTAVDLSAALIERCRENLAAAVADHRRQGHALRRGRAGFHVQEFLALFLRQPAG